MTRTSIEWADDSWNPIAAYDKETGKRGWFCTKVSPGCTNCYAENWNRFRGNGHLYRVGNLDKVRFELAPTLNDPLHWRKPRRVFVNSMTDLFLEAHTDEMIDRAFGVMALADRHQFLVLTKRPERMRDYFAEEYRWAMIEGSAQAAYHQMHRDEDPSLWLAVSGPLPNVWLGVSTENQAEADRRIPLLLETPAAIHFLSCEPLLGKVDLERLRHPTEAGRTFDGLRRGTWDINNQFTNHSDMPYGIDWVIAGGESGHDARPCDVAWIQGLIDQCGQAEVPCFVKQLGAEPGVHADDAAGMMYHHYDKPSRLYIKKLRDKKGGDMREWPKELRVRQYPRVEALV